MNRKEQLRTEKKYSQNESILEISVYTQNNKKPISFHFKIIHFALTLFIYLLNIAYGERL